LASSTIDTKDWTEAVITEIKQYVAATINPISDAKYISYLDEILPLYEKWARDHYAHREVCLPEVMAQEFVHNGVYLMRSEEDDYLINEAKTRTELMTDEAWKDYCEEKDAIVYGNTYALLSDGVYHS